jgi:uncharacterized membrane protein YdcZ (DUF606 family)
LLLEKARMRTVRLISAVICFGLGVAFAFSAAELLMHPDPIAPLPVWMPGMLAGMFLLSSFLLLRRKS